jgi:hypothetical protein
VPRLCESAAVTACDRWVRRPAQGQRSLTVAVADASGARPRPGSSLGRLSAAALGRRHRLDSASMLLQSQTAQSISAAAARAASLGGRRGSGSSVRRPFGASVGAACFDWDVPMERPRLSRNSEAQRPRPGIERLVVLVGLHAVVHQPGRQGVRFVPRGVGGPLPSWNRSTLTEVYLCHAWSDHEIEDGNARAGRAACVQAPRMRAPGPRPRQQASPDQARARARRERAGAVTPARKWRGGAEVSH